MALSIGKRIAQIRRQKDMTQEDLAKVLGVTPQAVSKWENDITCPDINMLPKLAKLLGITTDELLSGKTEPAATILPQEQRKQIKDMMLRIVVDSAGGDKVRVNLPMALVEVALDSGLDVSMFTDHPAAKNIDLRQILELVRQGAMGNLVEVESAGGDTVRIFVE